MRGMRSIRYLGAEDSQTQKTTKGSVMAGNLYQLKTNARPGDYVNINGPHDRYGQVLKHQESGYHLIRGLGDNKPPATILHYAETE